MSVTYGFYNSINGDRKYNALEMSSIFDGIIVDGVYMSIGDALNVKSSGGMGITVGIGRAWFNHTWTLNDSIMPLTLESSDVLLNRIDAVVLEINNDSDVRKNTIKILKGTPASNPVKPSLIKSEMVNQYPLAYITIGKGVLSISQSNIENAIGTSACPYVTGVLKGMDIDNLVAQWGAQWAEWLSSNTDAWEAFMSENSSEFESWFQEMKDQLSTDAAGNLQASKMDKATYDADGDGVVDRAAASDSLKNGLTILSGGGKPSVAFDGSKAIELALNAGFVGAEPAFTKNNAFNKNFGSAAGTVCQGNDSRLSNARRASNISMSYNGNLWISYS